MKHPSRWISFVAAGVILAGVAVYVSANLQTGSAMGPPGGPPPGGGADKSSTAVAAQPVDATPNNAQAPGQSGIPPQQDGSKSTRSTVSVISRSPASYRATISAYGQANPHYSLTLVAQVSGQVTHLAEKFESGQRLSRGDMLAQLDDSSYRAALSDAEYALASARLALLEAEREALQARAEWEAAGLEGEPDSPLVLHQPQVATARAAVANSETALANARNNLAHTRISVPFDALVVERLVAPGAYVQAGGEIATLYSTDRVEIEVALSARDWSSLPASGSVQGYSLPATLTRIEDGRQWNGRVTRVAQHLDDSDRQRALIVAVDQPFAQSPPLLPGSFVEVSLQGREVDGLWQLPSSALSQRNEIWYVSDDDTLDSFAANPVFSDANGIYVSAPAQLAGKAQRVLVQPLSSYVKGMPVIARDMEHGDSTNG
jgi:RND family efflux transporter MFP subunit